MPSSDGLSSSQAWNANIMDLIAAAKAHCLVVVQRTFAKGAAQIKDRKVGAAMQTMVAMFSLHHISSNAGDLLRCGFLTAAQVCCACSATPKRSCASPKRCRRCSRVRC